MRILVTRNFNSNYRCGDGRPWTIATGLMLVVGACTVWWFMADTLGAMAVMIGWVGGVVSGIVWERYR